MSTLQKAKEEKAPVQVNDRRLDPWGEFDRMRQAMDALFSGFWPRRLLAESATPAVNMYRGQPGGSVHRLSNRSLLVPVRRPQRRPSGRRSTGRPLGELIPTTKTKRWLLNRR